MSKQSLFAYKRTRSDVLCAGHPGPESAMVRVLRMHSYIHMNVSLFMEIIRAFEYN